MHGLETIKRLNREAVSKSVEGKIVEQIEHLSQILETGFTVTKEKALLIEGKIEAYEATLELIRGGR